MTTDFSTASRNPFHVLDAPDPDGEDVVEFASTVRLSGSADDPNAAAWNGASSNDIESSLRGNWSSRWVEGVVDNGRVDAAVPIGSPVKQKFWKLTVVSTSGSTGTVGGATRSWTSGVWMKPDCLAVI